MKNVKKWVVSLSLGLGLVGFALLPSCGKFGAAATELLMPAVEEDVKLGQQVSSEIEANSKEYPILNESNNREIYAYIRNITSKIVNGGAVKNAKNFPWQVKIIDDPKTLNAFCTPGGYIYVYTGIIKYLDSEDQLAGVMSHEIAHADQRHSMRQLVKMYGVQLLLQIGAGVAAPRTGEQTAITIAQIAGALTQLKFSREHETDADNQSVNYLCNTEYNSDGAAGFFEKIGNAGSPPEFMSTHPNPTNRVANIKSQAAGRTCQGKGNFKERYAQMKGLLR